MKLIHIINDYIYEVRWNIVLNEETNEYTYNSIAYHRKPTLERIQKDIIRWFNSQTDKLIKYGFTWKGIEVYLSDENKFNYKAIIDEVEISPDLLPVTLKLGKTNEPENFYTFTTLEELREFFSAGVRHLINAYGSGWNKIASFDWAPYEDALKELDN